MMSKAKIKIDSVARQTSSQTNLDVAVCGSTDVDVSDAPGAPDEYGDIFPEPGR